MLKQINSGDRMFLSSRVLLVLSGTACLLATQISGFSSFAPVRSKFGVCSYSAPSVLAVSSTAEDNNVESKDDATAEVTPAVVVEVKEDAKVYIGNLAFGKRVLLFRLMC
jgi:hypothetical protein